MILSITFIYQSINAQWIQRYNSSGNNTEYPIPKSMVMDKAGNVYVSGTIYQTNLDFVTIKYDPNGNQKWVQRYNGPVNGDEYISSIAVDDSANVYISGCSVGSESETDNVLIKYNQFGTLQWVKRYNGPWEGAVYYYQSSIITDKYGNIYFTAGSNGIGTSSDIMTIKYNSNGDSLWVRRYNSPDSLYDGPGSIALDNSGNVFVSGSSNRYNNFGMSYDFITLKYDSSGIQSWVQFYNGTGNDYDGVGSMKIDKEGNVIASGLGNYNGATGYEYMTVIYDNQGNRLWVRTYSEYGPFGTYLHANETDDSGNVYVAGQVGLKATIIKYNATGDLKWIRSYPQSDLWAIDLDHFGNIYAAGSYSGDFMTLKYNQSAELQWVKTYNGTANGGDEIYCLVVDSLGNCFVSGASQGSGTSNDIVTINYPTPQPTINITVMFEGLYNISSGLMVKDTVKIYIRRTTPPYLLFDSASAVLDSNGKGTFNFHYNINYVINYYIVRHRNSLETWSNPQSFSNINVLNYDFTASANKAYGNNLVLKGSKYCIYSGDVNQDRIIDLFDVVKIYNDAGTFATGYRVTDLNGDNITDIDDILIAYNNSLTFAGLIRP